MGTQGTTHIARVVGANISGKRKALEMTQLELATACGTSISRVSGWELGKGLPGARNQQALADALFDGEIADLFREPERLAA